MILQRYRQIDAPYRGKLIPSSSITASAASASTASASTPTTAATAPTTTTTTITPIEDGNIDSGTLSIHSSSSFSYFFQQQVRFLLLLI